MHFNQAHAVLFMLPLCWMGEGRRFLLQDKAASAKFLRTPEWAASARSMLAVMWTE